MSRALTCVRVPAPCPPSQQRFLKEAQNSVKKNAYFMRKAMVGAAASTARSLVPRPPLRPQPHTGSWVAEACGR
jgi:hypothetical protein